MTHETSGVVSKNKEQTARNNDKEIEKNEFEALTRYNEKATKVILMTLNGSNNCLL